MEHCPNCTREEGYCDYCADFLQDVCAGKLKPVRETPVAKKFIGSGEDVDLTEVTSDYPRIEKRTPFFFSD